MEDSCLARSSWGRELLLVAFGAGAACAAIAAYNASIDRRVKATAGGERDGLRADLARRLALGAGELVTSTSVAASLARVDGQTATGQFLSAIIKQLWSHMSVAIASAVKEIVEPMLMDTLPVKVQFTRLDLGKIPIKTTNMFIHRTDLENKIAGYESKNTGVQVDFDMEWDGDCDVMLRADLKPVGVSFGVKNFKLCGRMYLILSPLTEELPVVSAAQYGFINPPKLDMSFTGAASVLSSLKVIEKKIPVLIQNILNGLLVLPERMVTPIDYANYNYLDTYQPPVGMVRIAILKGRGFAVLRKFLLKDIPDVYCEISLGASKSFRTSTKRDNLYPVWEGESQDFMLYDMDQTVYLRVLDEDSALEADSLLGSAEVSVRDLFGEGGGLEVELEKDGMKHGIFVTLSAELFRLSPELESLSSPKYGGKNQLCGLATIAVIKAHDIPLPKEDAATSVACVYGAGSEHEQAFCTAVVADAPGYDSLNPMYDSVFHVPLTGAMTERKKGWKACGGVTFRLVDAAGSNGSDANGELGKIVVSHERLLDACEHLVIETTPIGDWGARLEYAIRLQGMRAEDEVGRRDSNVTIKITAVKGRGFLVKKQKVGRPRLLKNGAGYLDDPPNVYCKVYLCTAGYSVSKTKWKTSVVKDTDKPEWSESKVFADVDPKEGFIRVDVYDHGTIKDNFLGRTEFLVRMLLRGGSVEKELKKEFMPTKTYVTFSCEMLDSGKGRVKKAENLPSIAGKEEKIDNLPSIVNKDAKAPVDYPQSNVKEGEELRPPQLRESLLHTVAENEKVPTALPRDQDLQPTLVEEPSRTSSKEVRSDCSDEAGDALSGTGRRISIRVRALHGRDFPVKKHRVRKDDVPDVYCKVHLRGGGSLSNWKTAVIKNSTRPKWHETKVYGDVDPSKAVICVDAYQNGTIKHHHLGHVEFPVGVLLEERLQEKELLGDNGSTGMYITFGCDPV